MFIKKCSPSVEKNAHWLQLHKRSEGERNVEFGIEKRIKARITDSDSDSNLDNETWWHGLRISTLNSTVEIQYDSSTRGARDVLFLNRKNAYKIR